MSDLADQVAAVEGQKADLEQKINAVASEADSLYEENERLQGRLIGSIALVGAIPLPLRDDWWALSRADGSPCQYQKSYAYGRGSDAQ